MSLGWSHVQEHRLPEPPDPRDPAAALARSAVETTGGKDDSGDMEEEVTETSSRNER